MLPRLVTKNLHRNLLFTFGQLNHSRYESDIAVTRVNKTIRLTDPIVRDSIDLTEFDAGKKVAFCRCWQSKKFPRCDGAHKEFNKLTGDNLGPLIISTPEKS